MKKQSTFLFLIAAAATATAAAATHVPAKAMDKLSLPDRKVEATAARSSVVTDVIYEAEGTMQQTLTTGTGSYVYLETLVYYENETVSNHVVYGDDGEVYFFNLLPYAGTDTYVKGQIEGDQVMVELPQTLLVHPSGNYAVNLDILKYGNQTFEPTDEMNSVSFSIADDGTMTLEPLPGNYALGYIYTDDDSFAGYSANELMITPFDQSLVELPEDAEPELWGLVTGSSGYMIDVAIVDNDIYFGNVFPESLPDIWLKGTIVRTGDKAQVKVPNRQFMGVDYDIPCYLYFMTEGIETDDDYEEPQFMADDYEFVFDFDEAEKLLLPVDEEIMWVAGVSDEEYYPIDEITRVRIHYQDGYAGTPANPYGLTYLTTDFGKNGFIFYIPAVSKEITVLDPEYLYYRVYVDGEPFVFTADLYDLDEDMELVPFDFDNDNIQNYGGATRWIWLFEGGMETLGVQSVYKYDGVETESEIVSITLETALDKPTTTRTIVSETYYDLSGRVVAHPTGGFYIVKRTYTDGSCETTKFMSK